MRLILPLAVALALAAPAPAHAQHEGHVMPPPKPPATTRKPPPAAKPVAKPAPKPAAKAKAKPAATSKPPATKAPAKPAQPARKTATPAATPAAVDHSTMDHSKMDHSKMDHSSMEGMDHSKMDHSKMDHSKMEGMDHSTMDHSKMDHSKMEGMDHSKMDHSKMGHPTSAPITPIPPVTQADREAAFPVVHAHHLHGTGIHSYWLLDRLEVSESDDGTALGWEATAWIGGDIQRLWLRSEGEAVDGRIEHGDVEVLYGRSVRAWWDVLAGVRQDFGEGPSRTWAAFGVQGLAPYWFEVSATAYIGQGGRTALRGEAEYETLVTNRLILQWRAEANAHGKDDPLAGIGAGLSTAKAGARLRYEITRQFAPYIGVEHHRAFGTTADMRRASGHDAGDTRVVAGVRIWF